MASLDRHSWSRLVNSASSDDLMTGAEPENERQPGDRDVDSTVVCVLTRFALRRPWHLVQTYVAYRWLMKHMRRKAPEGLLRACFLVENATTCYSLSLWADEAAIPHFGTAVGEHVDVANGVFGRLRFVRGGPELWSTKWRLFRVSNNLRWDGLDVQLETSNLREEV
jgi:hypothetical protein